MSRSDDGQCGITDISSLFSWPLNLIMTAIILITSTVWLECFFVFFKLYFIYNWHGSSRVNFPFHIFNNKPFHPWYLVCRDQIMSYNLLSLISENSFTSLGLNFLFFFTFAACFLPKCAILETLQKRWSEIKLWYLRF